MNETEARELLHAAAGTIVVPPGRETPFEERPRPRWHVPAVAAAAVVLAVGAGALLITRDDAPAPADGGPLPQYTADADPLPGPTAPRVVPDVIGLRPGPATELLESVGAEVKRIDLLAECLERPGTVASTDPEVGEPIPAGATVRIKVCPAVENGLTGDDTRIAQRVLDFARGIDPEGGIPTDVPIDLYLGGTRMKTITAAESGDPASYVVCVEGYADKTCPFSAIESLRQAGDGVAIADTPLRPAQCAVGETLPTDHVGPGHSVFLNAAGIDSCIDGFSVQLVYNDVGQVTDINLLVGSP